ncbi:thioredoxin-domain-containing protein [Teratosphaeria nubilosa]|uniref:Thioredoxin-domain-containing protein n=1 Tax=Teratosphaeria nubilosa TaxID=161662 RepID=A0A6G1LJ31_9PEZI|nr:thioredoxin-domain-containing protein [Teratosphaeria nubilosa]
MSASTAFRRTFLTTTRFSRPTTITTAPQHFYRVQQPLFTNYRRFAATMSNEKEGVHNIKCKEEWDTCVKEKGCLLVLDCFATWCGPCKVIAPQVVKFSDTYKDARFYKLDVDEVPEVAQELSVRAMPTFLLFKDGEKVGEVVGANPTALETAIKNNLKSSSLGMVSQGLIG